jgi:putative ABC transport system permease protein
VSDVARMEEVTASALAGPRFAAFLLGVFAFLALTLAAIGTYATVSLLVTERTQEIGIRMALGAERRAIAASILREGLLLAAGGVGIGTVGALLASRVLESMLFGVRAIDPVTFVIVPVVLVLVAVCASLLPARRAAALDPVIALRRG